MDPKVHIKDYHKFAVSRNNSGKSRYINSNPHSEIKKSRKYGNRAIESQGKDLQQLTRILYGSYEDKNRGYRGQNYSNEHYNDYDYEIYNSHYDRRRHGQGQGQYAKSPYVEKSFGNSNANTASDSDGNDSNQGQDLYGFKIVHNGSTIHENRLEDFDYILAVDSEDEKHVSKKKYAASTMTITPQLQKISIPSFI